MKNKILLGCFLAASLNVQAQNPFSAKDNAAQPVQPKAVTTATTAYSYAQNYLPPASSGVIWLVINPAYLDYKSYAAKFTVVWGSYSKTITLPGKSGEQPYIVGFTHWDNNQYYFNVTMNPSGWSNNTRAQIISIAQGAQPTGYPYATLYRCGVNLNC